MRRLAIVIILFLGLMHIASAQRRVTPVNTAATATQPVNENKNDTARINARLRASMVKQQDAEGNVIYVDTLTGKEWRDTLAPVRRLPMKYPLLQDVSIGVDIWDPVMRAFGQKYGLIGFSGSVNLHNRYMPTFEVGLGQGRNTPDDNNYTYRSPLSVYFKIGGDYNFLYNGNPDYKLSASVRYGISPFSYDIEDITVDSPVWGNPEHPTIPTQHATVGWIEVGLALRVKIYGPISAGWRIFFHSRLHESKCEYGKPWYIPGYGSRTGALTGSFSIFYTLPFKHREKPQQLPVDADMELPSSESADYGSATP